MQKLEPIVKIRGTGIEGLTSTLIKRTKKKAIYLRSDGYYEIFKVKIEKASIAFGREFPEREVYPGNEDFGKFAWCVNTEKEAYKIYEKL